ncbi:UNVERIFIED_CONTAM: hypothetical protein Sradi_6896100 [Sesamum radiatum]|uniref:Uncharacterized protein n=1 Tax=Sesamum radiatum TaxID=300843 RepID=A0AAW2JIF8_SESRA
MEGKQSCSCSWQFESLVLVPVTGQRGTAVRKFALTSEFNSSSYQHKREPGEGLQAARSEPSGKMDTEFGGQVIAFERDNSSTIGAGLTTQLSKWSKRHILKFFPAS